jgi:uncharacterized protein (DUF1330 family)
MGKIKQGILGGFSGKVAGVVGSSWKGINVMRAMPISVANPRTASQIEQRNKFSSSIYFAKKILSTAIKPLWDRWAVGMSGYNAFIARNIEYFGPDYLMEPENLIFSEGKMSAVSITTITFDPDDMALDISWLPNPMDAYQSSDDIPYVGVWISEVKDKVDAVCTNTTRSAGTYHYTGPFDFATGEVVHVWLGFKRKDGTIVSNSSYLSYTIPA